jgi:hypothetical protein
MKRIVGAWVLGLGVCHGPAALAQSDITPFIAVHRPWAGDGAVRTMDGLVEGVPGVRPDVEGPAINGGTASENSYRLEGLSTNDAFSGDNALPLSAEFLTNVNVVTSGYMAEYGRATGGILEADLKGDYGDGIRGAVFGYWTPGLLSSRDASGRSVLKHQGDFGATLGGRLARNLSFFAGVAPALGRVTRTLPSLTAHADRRTLQGVAKLSYILNGQNWVALSFITTPGSSRDGTEALAPRELDSNVSSVRLKHSGAYFDGRLLLDTRAGWTWQRAAPAAEGAVGEPGLVRAQDRFQANARLTYLLNVMGTHVLKAGVDTELVTAEAAAEVSRRVLGAYVQDSWSLFNRFTVNAGLRQDAQWLSAGAGAPTLRVGGWVPRLGLVMDPFANGRMRLFTHVAKYEGLVPAGLLASPERGATVDPALKPPTSRELVVGTEYELFAYVSLGANYTHRDVDAALQYLPWGDGTEVLLANPGRGLAAGTPEAARTYDAGTVWLDGRNDEGWRMRFSYTASRLRGNTAELVPLPAEPGFAAEATPVVLEGSGGLLPADRTHLVKAAVAREVELARNLDGNFGLSYLGASGAPRAEGGRTPWLHTLDAHVGLGYWLARESRVELNLDVFNVLDVQEDTPWDGSAALRLQAPRQVRLGARYLFL